MPGPHGARNRALPAQRRLMQQEGLVNPSAQTGEFEAGETEVKAAAQVWAQSLRRNFAQHFDANLALRDFAQCSYRRFVARINFWRVTLCKLTRAISGGEAQLEAIRNLFQTIFYGDAGHGGTSMSIRASLTEAGALCRYPAIPNCVKSAW